MRELCASVTEAIGETPLVCLSRLTGRLDGEILAKLEYLNPGFSKKDRIAKQIIEDAEAAGELDSGRTIVELTSGNTGTGLAIVSAIKGYRFVAVMSRGNSVERVFQMRAFGAEVVLVDQVPGSRPGSVSGADLELVEAEAARLTRERGAFRADQFFHEGNFRAHYLHTGPEILAQAGGRVDGFCDFVGSGGTFAGCAAAFKENDPQTRCYVVEPEGAAVLADQPVTMSSHPIQGGGYARAELKFVDSDHVDGHLQVNTEETVEACHELARTEGIFAGFSSGANLAAAMQLLRGELKGKRVVITINDSGLKYLSTDLWDRQPATAKRG
jgi:cysteine synthase A